MRSFLILLLGAILIGVLSYFCFLDKAGGIKDDLVSKTQGVYADKEMDWVDTNIKGDNLEMTRVLTLSGTAPSETLKADAERIALLQEGVDGVENNLVVAAKSIAVEEVALKPATVVRAPTPYTMRVTKSEDEKIVLSGYVSNAKVHADLVEQAKTAFGAENVTDELKEFEGAPAEWQSTANMGLDKLTEVDYGEYIISDENFYFKGFVDDVSKKEPLIQSLKKELHSEYLGHYDIASPKQAKKEVYSCQDGFRKILSGNKIHFEYNKADVKSISYAILDSLVEVAKKCPQEMVSIEGHTDSIGSKIYNKSLSTSRANAVKDYLESKGLSTKRLEAVGFGESKPIADNMVKEGRAKNRRIEFNIKGVK